MTILCFLGGLLVIGDAFVLVQKNRSCPRAFACTSLANSRQESGSKVGANNCAESDHVESDSTGHTLNGRRRVLQSLLASTASPRAASALSPEQASTDYDSYATSYNQLDGGKAASVLGLDEARSRLLKKAKGRVLEIGAGTGLNLEFYQKTNIRSLCLVDISQGMLQKAKERASSLGIPVEVKKADATRDLVDMFGPNSFDTVVDTFSLCVMGNQGAKQALEQASQVVKSEQDGGRILLLENSRASNPLLGWYQDVTAETAAAAGGKGCVYNQDVQALIEQTHLLNIVNQEAFAGGLFRSFECTKPRSSV